MQLVTTKLVTNFRIGFYIVLILSTKGEFLRLSGGPIGLSVSLYLMLLLDFFFSPKDPSSLTSLIVCVVLGGGVFFEWRIFRVAYFD